MVAVQDAVEAALGEALTAVVVDVDHGPTALVEEVVEVANQFGIVTPYTAYLAEEPDMDRLFAPEGDGAMFDMAMEAITDDQRAAIVLYDVHGYDYGEIAAITGVSTGTVKSRIHRARQALREHLKELLGRSAAEGV